MTPSELYGGRRRAVRRNVSDELRAMRTAVERPDTPRRNVDRRGAAGTAVDTGQDAPDGPVPAAQGIALAERLKAAGISSAAWVREPRSNRYRLDVDGAEAARAVELLRTWKD